MVADFDGVQIVGHAGDYIQYSSILLVWPSTRTAVAVLGADARDRRERHAPRLGDHALRAAAARVTRASATAAPAADVRGSPPGSIVLEWKDATPGATTKGVFTLEPTSETEGTLTTVMTGKGPGWSTKSRTAGPYRIEVSATRDDGSPSELLVVHSTKGTVRTCAGGPCTTKKVDLGEGTIPLEVLSGKCPVTP